MSPHAPSTPPEDMKASGYRSMLPSVHSYDNAPRAGDTEAGSPTTTTTNASAEGDTKASASDAAGVSPRSDLAPDRDLIGPASGDDSRVTEREIVVSAVNLTKTFVRDSYEVRALDGASIEIARGEFVALMGPSGSGKSTLLHLTAAMDRPTSGTITVLGHELSRLSEGQIARWRNIHIGFIFQSFNLIPVLTALENVELPLKLTHLKSGERRQHAITALNLVGLGDRMRHYPRQLSGGQEQRVAIARAIVTDPDILLCDEPTGNLDSKSAVDVLSLLSLLNKDFGKTVVMVTHDPHAAHYATKVRHLEKGKLLPEGQVPEDWKV